MFKVQYAFIERIKCAENDTVIITVISNIHIGLLVNLKSPF